MIRKGDAAVWFGFSDGWGLVNASMVSGGIDGLGCEYEGAMTVALGRCVDPGSALVAV